MGGIHDRTAQNFSILRKKDYTVCLITNRVRRFTSSWHFPVEAIKTTIFPRLNTVFVYRPEAHLHTRSSGNSGGRRTYSMAKIKLQYVVIYT